MGQAARNRAKREDRTRAEGAAAGIEVPPGAVDLAAIPVPLTDPEERAEVLKAAEVQKGYRCLGCGERITKGWQFVLFDAARAQGEVFVNVQTVNACSRKECDFAFRVGQEAVLMEPVEFKWLDSPDMRAFFASRAPAGEEPPPSAAEEQPPEEKG